MTVMRRSISRLEHRLLRTTRVGSTRILLFADDVPEMSFFNENSDVRGVRAHVSVYGVASRQCVREYQSRISLVSLTHTTRKSLENPRSITNLIVTKTLTPTLILCENIYKTSHIHLKELTLTQALELYKTSDTNDRIQVRGLLLVPLLWVRFSSGNGYVVEMSDIVANSRASRSNTKYNHSNI